MDIKDIEGYINKPKEIEYSEKESELEPTKLKEKRNGWYIFLNIFFIFTIIGILTIGGLFVYYVREGKLQSIYQQEIKPLFDATVNNNYDFKPSTDNKYFNNYTIINKIYTGGNCSQ